MLVVGGVLFLWFILFRWMKIKIERLKFKIMEENKKTNEKIILEPQSALFRGSDASFGNIKGNGVICLTSKSLSFEKLIGQKININRADIVKATVEDSFKGKTSFATGGRHLVIKTKNGNRIGFLIKEAEEWCAKINNQ